MIYLLETDVHSDRFPYSAVTTIVPISFVVFVPVHVTRVKDSLSHVLCRVGCALERKAAAPRSQCTLKSPGELLKLPAPRCCSVSIKSGWMGAEPRIRGLLKIPRGLPYGPVLEQRGERPVQLCSVSSCEGWVFYSFSLEFCIIPFLKFCQAGCWEMTLT